MNVKNFNHSEISNFLHDEISEIKLLGLAKINPTVKTIDNLLTTYLKGLGRQIPVSNPLTKKLSSLRTEVQKEYSRFNQLVKAYCLRREEEPVATAAERIKGMLSGFRGMAKMPYRSQIEMCKKAFGLLKSDYATDVNQLGLSSLVSSLNDLIGREEAIFDKKVLMERPESIPMDKIRSELSRQYDEVMKYIDAVDLVAPTEGVTKFLEHHRARLSEMQRNLHRRRGNRKASLAKKREELRELALACGWKLPIGKEDFDYFGSSRILHPELRRWFVLKEETGVKALVELPTKGSAKRQKGREYVVDLSRVNDSSSTTSATATASTDKDSTESHEGGASNAAVSHGETSAGESSTGKSPKSPKKPASPEGKPEGQPTGVGKDGGKSEDHGF